VLHQAMDCLFMGPYSKVDYVIGSPDGRLPDLTWFRDNNTGETRDFDLPCTGEKLHGDRQGTPFTCGSPARRSVIKSYVREFLFKGSDAANVTASLITERLARIEAAWLDVRNYGCFDSATNTTAVSNCGDPLYGGRGYTPNLPDFTQVTSNEVTSKVLEELPRFFQAAMTDSRIWTQHYVDDVHTQPWGDWGDNPAVVDYHLYAPHEPIVSYNETEGANASETDPESPRFAPMRNSVWGVCTSLLSQPMLTLPLIRYAEDGLGETDGGANWMPKFVREKLMGEYDPHDKDPVEWLDGLLEEAWLHSPMHTHYVMRYRPSMSMACESSSVRNEAARKRPQQVQFRDTVLHYAPTATDATTPQQHVYHNMDGFHVPLEGYSAQTIGSIPHSCPCAEAVPFSGVGNTGTMICKLGARTCATIVHNIERALSPGNRSSIVTYKACTVSDTVVPLCVSVTYAGVCEERHASDTLPRARKTGRKRHLHGISSRKCVERFVALREKRVMRGNAALELLGAVPVR
jgi:hypothetical protein